MRFKNMLIGSVMRRLGTAALAPYRLSVREGHFRSSLLGRAVGRDGRAVPWYTYPAIDFLRTRDFSTKRILEFGSGQSTLWWSERAHQVVSVEEDLAWASYVEGRKGGNVVLQHIPVPANLDRSLRTGIAALDVKHVEPVQDFLRSVGGKYDVIIIDGHMRPELLMIAFDWLKPSGAIILDNAEGYHFWDILQGRGCRRFDFFGFAPGVSKQHCTAVVFVEDCFLLDVKAPIPTA